ncbi:MAG: hypothetical protein ALECFALPRED_006637 [Alectoria fallacina]|uniref:Uncharacterized protein n=1 Tax=Alectoria fallacina TaxID=1903189 RepID=A0A8H3IWS0_9LECA|nr:MAG: hypothetical protein ALECFALPRED_006637 [Alectoria fallacina]
MADTALLQGGGVDSASSHYHNLVPHAEGSARRVPFMYTSSLDSVRVFMLTSTSVFLTFWNLLPTEIKQMILCFMTIADLYHFSNIDPEVRYFCRHCEELITKLFINRIIELRPPMFRLYIRSFSPALGTFLCRLYQRRRFPASPPFRNLLLISHRFPIAVALAHQMALSQPACDTETLTKRVNTLTPGVILLCEFFERYRAKLASFVNDRANAIYFSNASPGITRRRLKIVQIERDILTNGFRYPAVPILYATYLWLIDLLDFKFPIPYLVGSITTYHEITLFGGLETVLDAIQDQNANLQIRQNVVASRLCRAVSGVLPARFTAVHLPASELVPTLEASTVGKMKRMTRSAGSFPCVANVAYFGLPAARSFEPVESIKRQLIRFAWAAGWVGMDLMV